ncbi:MAG TPA: LysR family transcriptional regulator [Ramlibacter sp.]|jgi:DNA-binding transcriptional LysR family regulator
MTAAASINLLAMKIFVAVFDHRSVAGAARSLGMSQSGMSTALAKLRKDLGDALFISTAAGMQPTPRAKDLVAPMREAIACIEQRILKKADFDPALDTREFRIAQSDVAEAIYMPRVMTAVAHRAPNVRLRTVEMPQAQLQRALSEGQVDLALGYFPDLVSSEFVRRKVRQHGFVCICSASNRRVIQGFDLEKFSEARHVIVEAPGRSQGLLERYMQQRGIVRRVAMTTPHFTSLPQIISQTDLIASIPGSLADCFSEMRLLARLELPFRSPVFESHLHWSRSLHGDLAHRWLRSVVFQALVPAT